MLGLKYDADIRAIMLLMAKYLWVAFHWSLYPHLSFASNAVFMFLGFVPAFITCCITHNAMHCSLFKYGPLESIFRVVLSAALGTSVELYIPTHNHNHHVHTNEVDSDHLETSVVKYENHALNLLLYFFHVAPGVVKLESAYMKDQIVNGTPIALKIIAQMASLYLFWGTLVYHGGVGRFLTTVFIPGWLGIYGILTINILQHDGCIVSDVKAGKGIDFNGCRNFIDPSLNYWTMNNGYHSIHHAFPALHWTKMKEKHDELVVPNIHPSLLQPSIIGYIFRTYFSPGTLPAHRKSDLKTSTAPNAFLSFLARTAEAPTGIKEA